MHILETKRLILRTWRQTDLPLMSEINQNPKVMYYFPERQSIMQTKAFIDKCMDHYKKHGFTFYALELKGTGEFIGFTGIAQVGFVSHFTPAVEIGWRLAYRHWGEGFAPEAAQAVLTLGFDCFHLPEIIAFCVKENQNSRRVMEKIGMQYDPQGDFDHPKLAQDSLLKGHVLYRLKADKKTREEY
ncbi:GNAT family N-acetyltransferase [Facilibium subflavum]|uniref:GNAT family N-acetyltransferase n=1 Tax=Facilibium subflavum TaxID=2219058 RepID=UPI000E65B82B|nr:GNAT family N-acetyltransferase [Facilibium subflavum]